MSISEIARYLATYDARVCDGCQEPPPPGETLVVVQDRKTGAVLALLCSVCYGARAKEKDHV